jgi:hypothetical protein
MSQVNDLKNLVNRAIEYLPLWRHQAVYQSMGYDEDALADLMNLEGNPFALNRKVLAIRHLNEALMIWQSRNLRWLTEKLRKTRGEEIQNNETNGFPFMVAMQTMLPSLLNSNLLTYRYLEPSIDSVFRFWQGPIIRRNLPRLLARGYV